jgi:ubiquinone/menaquinone biosynthesis C-methylase UbiE
MSQTKMSVTSMFDDLAATYETSTGGGTRDVARQLIDMLPPVGVNSSILDNACGNGIVAQELFSRYPDTPLSMICVDISKPMVDLARRAVPPTTSAATVSFDVMPGENLSFLNETFTHSITNMSMFFFSDPVKGAREIYRTLKPSGTAIVTTWKYAGYLSVLREAQKAVNPDVPLFDWPIADEWYQASCLKETLEKAGFKHIEMDTKKAHYAFSSLEETIRWLFGIFKAVGPKWSEEEDAEFQKQLVAIVKREVVTIKRRRSGKKDAEVVELVGLPMEAHVAVIKK